jgi:5-methylcytosine-specific restriction protein A
MTKRALRPCAEPGCPELVKSGKCLAHALPSKGARAYDAARGTAAARGYGWLWQKNVKAYIAAHPICVDPYGRHPGEVRKTGAVDHIIPLDAGGSNKWVNLQSLCRSCHAHKTAIETAAETAARGRAGKISVT